MKSLLAEHLGSGREAKHWPKPNLPEYVRDVADYLAMLRGESYERFAEQTTENFKRLFPLAHVGH